MRAMGKTVDIVPDLFQGDGKSNCCAGAITIEPSDSFEEFERWVYQAQIERLVPVGILIQIISTRLRKADSQDYCYLALLLVSFLRGRERDSEALELLDQVIERCPDNVRAPLCKAERLLYFLDNPEGALKSVDVALERA